MDFLEKRILITGLLNNRSIAYGIAKAMHREARTLHSASRERSGIGVELAAEFGSRPVLPAMSPVKPRSTRCSPNWPALGCLDGSSLDRVCAREALAAITGFGDPERFASPTRSVL